MTILPKKTSQRPPGGGGGASAEGAQEHQHPQGGHFNISSQVGKGRSYKPYLEEPAHNEIYPDCTPLIPCAENFSRGSSFFRCPAQNVTPSPSLMKIDLLYIFQAAEAHERLFVSAGGKSHSCVDLSVVKRDSLPD